jgi:hypothetical protein
MVDVVSSQILENGPRFIVAKYTSLSDATGEAGVTKLDATSTGPFGIVFQGNTLYPGIHLSVLSVWFSVVGMTLRVQWHATANLDIFVLNQSDNWQFLDANRGGFAGITPPVGPAGITGSIDFTTAGALANSGYTIILKCAKNIPTR